MPVGHSGILSDGAGQRQKPLPHGPFTFPFHGVGSRYRRHHVRRTPIDAKEASVAATFYQPIYQRLQQWRAGRFVDLLCFVSPTNERVRRELDHFGANPSRTQRSKCFAEVWELDQLALEDNSAAALGTIDRRIADAIGCLEGKYSAACGTLVWTNAATGSRRHVESQLVREGSRQARSRG